VKQVGCVSQWGSPQLRPENGELKSDLTRQALFYVSLTVHLSIFILIINQLDAQNLFYSKFISCLYMF
jgi:hypothetical protein